MGALKFRLNPPDLATRIPDLRKAYVTGPDRTPERGNIELRPGMLVCHRESSESARVQSPWPVDGFGQPMIGTATLSERNSPHDLAVELARGRLNDVRNQVADWQIMGLAVSAELAHALSEAQRAFARAATLRDRPDEAVRWSRRTIDLATSAGVLLIESYTSQVLRMRLEHAPKLPTLLECSLEGEPKRSPIEPALVQTFNSARVRCAWADLAPDEGKHRWDEPDAQVHWCRKRKLAVSAGPLIEFRPGALPDWLWLWDGDFEEIQAQASDIVRQAVTRYRGKVAVWHVVHRPAEYPLLGLSEDEQIRLTARLLQVARQADENAQLVIDFDRPWAEWMSSSSFKLGPLHLADSLARADLGLSGIGLEIAPGYSTHGSHLRDLFEFSRLLDLFALINQPIYVGLALPSSAAADPKADESVKVETSQWPRPPDEELQKQWASSWVALALAKPFVRCVTWLQTTDARPHLFPHGGIFRPDLSPKPLAGSLLELRERLLS